LRDQARDFLHWGGEGGLPTKSSGVIEAKDDFNKNKLRNTVDYKNTVSDFRLFLTIILPVVSWVTNKSLILARNYKIAMTTFGAKFLLQTSQKPTIVSVIYHPRY